MSAHQEIIINGLYWSEISQKYFCTQIRLFRWKGSVYRQVWNELLLWLVLYYAINCVYRFVLSPEDKAVFEQAAADVDTGISFIPLPFVLGFYANVVVRRYWNMWDNLPRPDSLALRITSIIQGKVNLFFFSHL